MTDEQAGKFAQDSFLDYSINAPWIHCLAQDRAAVHRLQLPGNPEALRHRQE